MEHPKKQPNALQILEAQIETAALAEAGSLISVVMHSGAEFQRMTWDGPISMQLSMKPEHIRMERLTGGNMPLLKDHVNSVDYQLGTVQDAGLKDGKLVGHLAFGADDQAQAMKARVESKSVRNLSIGLQIHKLKDITAEDSKTKKYLAIDWEPVELSLVAVPADAGATVLSLSGLLDGDGATAPIPQEILMTNEPVVVPGAAVPAPDIKALQLEAQTNERTRVTEIHEITNTHKLGTAFLSKHISEGTTLDGVRSAALTVLSTSHGGTAEIRNHVEIKRDRFDSVKLGLQQALEARCGMKTELKEGSEFQGLTLMEMSRAIIRESGGKPPAGKMELVADAFGMTNLSGGTHTTSDFPNILANVANKSLMAAYEYAAPTYRTWAKQSTAPDFRTMTRAQFGDFPLLQTVNEGGEFKYGSVGDKKEQYALATYGRLISLSRQAIINDDLNAFTRIPQNIGAAVAYLENYTVYQTLIANAALSDGVALFNSGHANLAGAGSVISIASLSAARAAMRLQKGIDGNLFLNIPPKFLIVPTALETVAQQYTNVAGLVINKQADFNPFNGSLQVVTDAMLDGGSSTAWYLAADPMMGNTVEYAYLEGQQGVYTEQRVGWDIDGIEIKARLDFAAKPLDFRGLYKNPGA